MAYSHNKTLLESSFFGNTAEAAKELYLGADPNCRDVYGLTPYMLARRSGNQELVNMLIKAGAIQSLNIDWPVARYCHACLEEDYQYLEEFIDTINDSDVLDETPLGVACRAGSFEIIQWLVNNGADPQQLSRDESPLTIAMVMDRPDVVEFLVNNIELTDDGVWIEDVYTYWLTDLLYYGYYDIVKKFSEDKEELILHTAVIFDDPKALEFALSLKPNQNGWSVYGRTPLHTAVLYRSFGCLDILLNHRCDLMRPDSEGRTTIDFINLLQDEEIKEYIQAPFNS